MGTRAALFILVCVNVAQNAPKSLFKRFFIIGLLNGLLALAIPQIMGIGYDTVNLALIGQLPWIALFIFALAKLLITSLNLGLGQPGGAIGPMLFIGACAGGLVGELGAWLAPEYASNTGFYAMLGMAAMMSACLQAPLTALMTLLELTSNSEILLPAMLVVVIANLTVSEVFKQKALFPRLLQLRGLTVDTSPVEQMLRQQGVLSISEKDIKVVNKFSSVEALQLTLKGNPKWLVICNDDKTTSAIISASDVASLLLDDEQRENWLEEHAGEMLINLLAIPAQRETCGSISMQANLQEALDAMDKLQVECLSIHSGKNAPASSVMGIIKHDKIHNHYRYQQTPN